jgi:hypothetical protein
LITGRYSASTLLPNEIVFINVFRPDQAATRELLPSCRTEAHPAVKTRMGINLLPTDIHGDTITIVARKSNNNIGTWTLTGDIRIRFGNARVAISAYQQQRTHQNNRNTHAERLLTYDEHVCHTLIPSRHTNEES